MSAWDTLSQCMPAGVLQSNVALAEKTTLCIGGEAEVYYEGSDLLLMAQLLRVASEHSVPITVLGHGSNVIVADAGIPGLVLHFTGQAINEASRDGWLEINAEANVLWDDVVALAVERGAAGLECLSGIPGGVGAAPIQNIGAYGQEVDTLLVAVDTLDLITGERHIFSRDECGFGYRTSRFKTDWRGRYVVVAVRTRVPLGAAIAPARHPEVERRVGPNANLKAIRDAVLEIRREKGMLRLRENAIKSVGSFFLNPIISVEGHAALEKRCVGVVPQAWANSNGTVKLSAAWLIEQAGYTKGVRSGNVGISDLHSLAIVNYGTANAEEIIAFAQKIQQDVYHKFGVSLEPEPQRLGFAVDPFPPVASTRLAW